MRHRRAIASRNFAADCIICRFARAAAEVDSCYALLKESGAKIIHAAEEAPFWPGYYSLLCEDPDGTRIEMNYIPAAGWQAVGTSADAIAHGQSPLAPRKE